VEQLAIGKINGMADGVNTYFGKFLKLIFHKWEVAGRRESESAAANFRINNFRVQGQ
jgi:hypothetical protein